jgi:probable rRNA maturation factor
MTSQQTTLLFASAISAVSRRDLRAFAKRLESEVAGGRAFNCLLTTDRELQRLNRDFRKKDYPTDVLSFPAEETQAFIGEIAISVDRARAQAAEFGHALSREIEILMLHGVLHLLGMDHETDNGRMLRSERKWRTLLGLPPALIERVRA